MSVNAPFIVGLDGGGTHCRAVLFDINGSPLANAISGPANIARDFTTAKQSIIDAVIEVLEKQGLKSAETLGQTQIFAGLAGAQVDTAQQQLESWRHPFASFSAVSDLHAAAVGAHNSRNGAVLIMGTGSSAAALVEGKLIQYGGHGFLLGDTGSGAWIGLQAIRRILQALDGVSHDVESTFTLPILNLLEVDSTDEIVSLVINQTPAYFAKLAPTVVKLAECNEATAELILKQGAGYLSSIAMQALNQSKGDLCLIGGLSASIKPWLDNQVQAAIVDPIHGPEWGAVLAGK